MADTNVSSSASTVEAAEGNTSPSHSRNEDYSSDSDVDADLDGVDWSEQRGQDFTKQYNRQKRTITASADPNASKSSVPKQNPQGPKLNTRAYIDDQITTLSRHAAKLRLDDSQSGLRTADKGDKDRSDRATSEQVLDPRTRMILLQMINREIVSEIHGCISTGKEANVYYALKDDPARGSISFAIKVYKTAILSFKDRSKYVEGEYRFQHGAKVGSNRKMVKMWAEKEMRNLSRIYGAGIPCPKPEYLRLHVLAMGFLGDSSGWPAPRLHDVNLSTDQWSQLATLLLAYMRIMYQVCKLVHGDLSEYNVLYHENKPYIIDVSQSVEHDHPRSLELLRMDVKNVTSFFGRKGVDVFSEKRTFEFITDPNGPVEQAKVIKALEKLTQTPDPAENKDDQQQQVDEAVFRQAYMPQNLNEVYDFERDAQFVKNTEVEPLVYRNLLADPKKTAPGLQIADSATSAEDRTTEVQEGSGKSSSGDSADESTDEDRFAPQRPRGKRFEDKDEKKDHKKLVKEEKREKRKEKMPKAVKKKLVEGKSRRKR